jgi:hypothetical protein
MMIVRAFDPQECSLVQMLGPVSFKPDQWQPDGHSLSVEELQGAYAVRFGDKPDLLGVNPRTQSLVRYVFDPFPRAKSFRPLPPESHLVPLPEPEDESQALPWQEEDVPQEEYPS